MPNNINDRYLEIEKSVDKLISTQNKSRNIKLSDIDAERQYTMTLKFEVSRLRKLGFIDVTEDELNLKAIEKLNSNRDVEIEKSVNTLLGKRKQTHFNNMDEVNQYKMAINLEVTKLRKIGYTDITTSLLDNMVDNRIKMERDADKIIQNMENQSGLNLFVKQRGYTIVGILGLITCIATIGIIIYGYILFYK